MKKGYQLIEPRLLDPLFKYPNQHVILVPLLFWLADEINLILRKESKEAVVEVIKEQYVGPGFPNLGVHYLNRENPEDVGPLIESTIERILSEKPIAEFVKFASQNVNVNWNETLAKLMAGT
jgi:hypothetical protein